MPAEAVGAWLQAAIGAHQPSEAVQRQAEASGIDLFALKTSEPLTYAAINAVPLLRTDARLLPPVGAVLAPLAPHHQLFNVPLRLDQTDTELRIFPALEKPALSAVDDALGLLVSRQGGYLFYRTVTDALGEKRELAWPLAPEAWREGPAWVGPFAQEAEADAWGQAHTDPRRGLVFDTLPYAGAWFCDVFRGELGG